MALTKVERIALENEAREVYEAYQRRKGEIERIIRERVEREIAAEQGNALVELSRKMHEFYRQGLPKQAIRVATKKYGNNAEFLKIWNAHQPDDDFSLAPGRGKNMTHEWVANDSEFGYALIIKRDRAGNEIPEAVFENLEVQGDNIVVWSDLNNHPEHKEIGEKHFSGGWNLYKFATEQANAHREEINK